MKRWLPAAALVLGSVPLCAAPGSDFLRAELPARPAALAGAYAAQTDDAAAFAWNPAALGGVEEALLSATYLNGLVDTQFNHAALALPLRMAGRPWALGLSLQYAHTADFQEIDQNGQDRGTVTNYDLVMGLAAGLTVKPGLRFGLGLKAFDSRLAEFRSRGVAGDLGLQSDLAYGLAMGLSLADLGAKEAFDQDAEALPSSLRLALRWQALRAHGSGLKVLAQIKRYWDSNGPIQLSLGSEYLVAQRYSLRVGWRVGVADGPFSVGAGAAWEGFGLDYAYQPFGEQGAMHRVSLQAKLGVLFSRAQQALEEQPSGTDGLPLPTHIEAPPESK